MVQSMGTMMTKRDTTRFFLTSYAVDVAVRSLARNWVVFQGDIYAAPQRLRRMDNVTEPEHYLMGIGPRTVERPSIPKN